jgi:EAL domain-containing protein (putative c-di-GMP-specific phosphodiesterase class I)
MVEGSGDAALARLREAGFDLVLDDFGTGYSSLAYLCRIRFAGLKIDRSFVSRLPEPASLDLVGTIIALAERLGLKVTAEGIETEAQRDLLARLGCGLGQGWLHGRPMPLEGLAQWAAARAGLEPVSLVAPPRPPGLEGAPRASSSRPPPSGSSSSPPSSSSSW